ncbi:MAG: SUMF1/EgtB/PvdO family nonheme iron enzyme [Thermoguttaceae bacterium]
MARECSLTNVDNVEAKIAELSEKKKAAVDDQDFERAAALRDEIDSLKRSRRPAEERQKAQDDKAIAIAAIAAGLDFEMVAALRNEIDLIERRRRLALERRKAQDDKAIAIAAIERATSDRDEGVRDTANTAFKEIEKAKKVAAERAGSPGREYRCSNCGRLGERLRVASEIKVVVAVRGILSEAMIVECERCVKFFCLKCCDVGNGKISQCPQCGGAIRCLADSTAAKGTPGTIIFGADFAELNTGARKANEFGFILAARDVADLIKSMTNAPAGSLSPCHLIFSDRISSKRGLHVDAGEISNWLIRFQSAISASLLRCGDPEVKWAGCQDGMGVILTCKWPEVRLATCLELAHAIETAFSTICNELASVLGPPDWTSFTCWDGSFSLRHPPEWKPADSTVSAGASLSCFGPGQFTLLEAFGVESERLRGRDLVKSVADPIVALVGQDREGHSNGRLLRRQVVTFRNAEYCERVLISYIDRGHETITDYFLVGSGQRAVMLAIKVLSREYERQRGLYEQVLESLTTPWLSSSPVTPASSQRSASGNNINALRDSSICLPAHRSPPPDTFTNSIGMEFVLIPPGAFVMGSPGSEKGGERDELQHAVRITRPFYIGRFAITQAQFKRVMNKNPSDFSRHGSNRSRVAGVNTDDFPVENVSWEEASEFCGKLGQQEGRTYRLPTEAEWEYACRAGTSTPFHFGETCNGNQANCDGNSPYGTETKGPSLGRTTRAGSYAPNAFGLHDMHGNVEEWCADAYDSDYYESSPPNDPHNDRSNKAAARVVRGGYYYSEPSMCRSARRGARTKYNAGFRVVLEVKASETDLVPARNFVGTWQPEKRSLGRAVLGVLLGVAICMAGGWAMVWLVHYFLLLNPWGTLALSLIPALFSSRGGQIIAWGLKNRRTSIWQWVASVMTCLMIMPCTGRYWELWGEPIGIWQKALLVWLAILCWEITCFFPLRAKYDTRLGEVVSEG